METSVPVRMMKDTCAALAMVTFLSWMANVRTSFFIVRALVGNRNGLMLRSVGSNNMSPPVLCSRQEWHVVCQRLRKVYLFQLRGTLVLGLAFFFLLLLGVLCIWRLLVLLASLLCTKLGLFWCASYWARSLSVGWLGHYLHNLLGDCLAGHKIAYPFLEFFQVSGTILAWKVICASLSGTAQSPWL